MSNPLAGLTGEQADEAIEKLAAKVDQQAESLEAARTHLEEMRNARADLLEPGAHDGVPTAEAQPGTAAGTGKVGG